MAIENSQQRSEMASAAPESETEKCCLEEGQRIIRSTTQLFGQPVVLVPMYRRAKNPRFRRFQTFTLDLMQDERFVACIGRPNCNVAVLLGSPSGGLCTFDFDDDENAKMFLRHNEKFEWTLMTTGQRGRNLWFFLEGDFPDSFDVRSDGEGNVVEFRANGRLTIIHGTHPCGYSYRILQKALPIKIKWSEIKWPVEWSDQLAEPQSAVQRPLQSGPLTFPVTGSDARLDPAKLSNVVPRAGGSYNARCPACAVEGHDAKGNHLIVFPTGAFACVLFQGHTEQAVQHRAMIARLAGGTD
jgi:hypothetical protein